MTRPLSIALVTGLVLLGIGAIPAQARVFFVTSPGDRPDAVVGDHRCGDASGVCTLRAAVMEANATAGPDDIFLLSDVALTIPSAASDFEGEERDAASGDLDVTDDLRVTSPLQRATIRAPSGNTPPDFRIFQLSEGVELSLRNVGIREGRSLLGGGILNLGGSLELVRGKLTGNAALFGGAVYSRSGELRIHDSLLARNSSEGENGAAVFNSGRLEIRRSWIVDNAGEDGAVSSQGMSNSGDVLIVDSTISRNGGEDPGGLVNFGRMTILRSTISDNFGDEGGIVNQGKLSIVNSTVSHNRGLFEGGIANLGRGELHIFFSTITENVGESGAGGLHAGGARVAVKGSVIAGNRSGEDLDAPDCTGDVTSLGFNRVGVGDTCAGFDHPSDIAGSSTAPLEVGLEPLASYGGLNETHALPSGSVARDVAPRRACTWDHDRDPTTPDRRLRTDQRGRMRPSLGGDRRCDAGAFEAQKSRDASPRACGRGFGLVAALSPALAYGDLRRRRRERRIGPTPRA